MNKKGFIGIFVFLLCLVAFIVIIAAIPSTYEYEYVGKIINMEGGTSSQTLILELDTIGKTPYRTMQRCSNKIRIGQKVYWRKSAFGRNQYLWVKYAEDKYC